MKVATLLLLAYLSCFASAQIVTPTISVNAACSTSSGCGLSAIITNIATSITALTNGGFVLDISALGSGLNINVDAGLLGFLGANANLNFAALAVGAKNTLTVAANVAVQTANFTVSQSSTAFINGAVTVQNSASASATFVVDASSALWVSAGASVTSSTNVVVAGVANVQGSITSTTQYVQSNGQLYLNSTSSTNATVTAPSISIQKDAYLRGNGVIGGATASATATVSVDGNVAVGNSPGTVTINGDWRPSAASIFYMDIDSDTNYDKLYVTGKAYIAGGLRPTLENNYVPAVGKRFPFIFAAGGTDGSFSTTIGSPVAYTGKFSSSVTSNQVIANFSGAVTVVVSALVMVACVLASLL